jgi:hypothetical protein
MHPSTKSKEEKAMCKLIEKKIAQVNLSFSPQK